MHIEIYMYVMAEKTWRKVTGIMVECVLGHECPNTLHNVIVRPLSGDKNITGIATNEEIQQAGIMHPVEVAA